MSPEIIQNLVQVLSQNQAQAPRPLALHLAIQTMTFTSSLSALANLNAVSQNWSVSDQPNHDQLLKNISNIDPKAFAGAVQAEVQERVQLFAKGVSRLNDAVRVKAQSPLPCVLEEGSTRLLNAKGDGPPVILIPSLINRAYILDLGSKNSLVRSLADRGLDVYLVDWDAPGDQEKSFCIDDYIDRLVRIRDAISKRSGQVPMIAGYCMGGLLALALATRDPDKIAKIALLATPWDFSKMPGSGIQHLKNSMPWLRSVIGAMDVLSIDILQAMFAGIDPCATARKFRQFSSMPPESSAARAFVQLEDWLNDGVPLAGPVAIECLQDWYIDNTTASGAWQTTGEIIDPRTLDIPAYVAVPKNDIIVPPATALPLGEALPRADTTVLSSGHIGMIAGGMAKDKLYHPLATWLLNSG